jgi:hypothetical protein
MCSGESTRIERLTTRGSLPRHVVGGDNVLSRLLPTGTECVKNQAKPRLRVCADDATSNAGDKPKTQSNGRIGLRLLDGRPFNDGHLAEFLARDL